MKNAKDLEERTAAIERDGWTDGTNSILDILLSFVESACKLHDFLGNSKEENEKDE